MMSVVEIVLPNLRNPMPRYFVGAAHPPDVTSPQSGIPSEEQNARCEVNGVGEEQLTKDQPATDCQPDQTACHKQQSFISKVRETSKNYRSQKNLSPCSATKIKCRGNDGEDNEDSV